jgi:hypothetical protein
MNPKHLIRADMATGAISLVAITPTAASGVPLDVVLGGTAVIPEEGRSGRPDNAGPSSRPDNPDPLGRGVEADGAPDAGSGGHPENAGRPADVGPAARTIPVLPENASPRAHAAVAAAYEQQGMI